MGDSSKAPVEFWNRQQLFVVGGHIEVQELCLLPSTAAEGEPTD